LLEICARVCRGSPAKTWQQTCSGQCDPLALCEEGMHGGQASKVSVTVEDVAELEASSPEGTASGGRYSPRMMPDLYRRLAAN